MEIFEFEPPGAFEWILPTDQRSYSLFASLRGRPQARWTAPAMVLLKVGEDGEPRLYSDFPWLGADTPTLRERAVRALGDSLRGYGQFLPLACNEPVSLFNVTTVIQALDRERSAIATFDDGSIMAIEEHVFRPDLIGNRDLFKLPIRGSSVFLTDRIVLQIEKAGLAGAGFRKLWSSRR